MKQHLLLLFSLLIYSCFSCQTEVSSNHVSQKEKREHGKIHKIEINGQNVDFQDSISIISNTFILHDTSETFSYPTVSQLDIPNHFQKVPTFPQPIEDKNTYWLTFDIKNLDSLTQSLILYLGYEQEVEIFGMEEIKRTGTFIAERDRKGAIPLGFFNREEGFSNQVELNIEGNENLQLYIKLKRWLDKPLPLSVKLIDPVFFKKQTNPGYRHFWQGLFQGIILALILYHLLFFLMVKDITYLYYCLYMVCISMMTLGDLGYWQGHLFKNQPFWGWVLFMLLQYWTGIMTLIFMRSFVRLKKLMPKWDKFVLQFIWLNIGVLVLIIIAYLLTQSYQVVQWAKLIIVPFAAIGILFCYLLLRSKDTVALYFAIAGLVLSLAVLINGVIELVSQGATLQETYYLRFHLVHAVAVVHLLTFSLGIGYRRRQKDVENQRVKELEELKSRFYTNITHEFRTPLTVILGMNDNIKGHPQERSLIKRNAHNLLRLINQLLDLTKLESGSLKINLVQGDIISYLHYLTESFYSMASDKKVQLQFKATEGALIMDFDEEKIQHIIYNLLSNAIKFTPSGGKVALKVASIEKRHRAFLKIVVKDTGKGISTKHLPYIFDRFYQIDNEPTNRGNSNESIRPNPTGTGIGLSLTKELVQMMNGQIEVQSEIGWGTEFIILLPIIKKEETEQLDIATIPFVPELGGTAFAKPSSQQTTTKGEQPEILIIEDNIGVLTYIQQLLQNDYLVRSAKDGQQGIDLALEHIPDLIITDVMMPEKDGFEVCATLKSDERSSHIPIIMLTAKADLPSKLIGLEKGADAYLSKPFEKQELLLRLRKLLELRQRLQAYYSGQPSEIKTIPATASVENAFLEKLKTLVEKRIGDPKLSVQDLSKGLLVGQTQLYRKLKALTGKTPTQFIHSIRLKKAVELLKTTNLNISEIAYDLGYNDPNYFSRMFRKEFGKSPGDFR